MALSSHYFETPTGFRAKVKHSTLAEIETTAKIDTSAVAVETIDTFKRFDELEVAWNDLFARACPSTTVFQSFNWHWHWCRHYLKSNRSSLRIVAVWSDENLVMVWPLLVERSMGVSQLKWIGAPVSQYGDILIDERIKASDLLERVWEHILEHSKVDVIALEKVRCTSPVARLLRQRQAFVTGCLEAPYLEFGSAKNYDEYEKRYSARARKNRRRQRRRIMEMGVYTFKQVKTGAEARQLVEQSIEVKRDWLKAKGLVSRAFADKRFDAFFADVAGSREHPCGCLVSVIKSGSRPMAYEIGFKTGHTYFAHIGAYDHEFERYSPGSILMEDFLRASYDEGIEHYDLMAPSADYKMSWADDCVTMCDYAYPCNGLGYLYARGIIGLMRNAVKKTLEYTPGPLRRLTRPFFRMAGY